MATKNIKSINLLPEFLRTDKNSKFLSSTIDQLIQPTQLERIDGYVGSNITPTYNSTSDIYISESLPLRRNYQLDPALVVRDTSEKVQDVISFDDLVNEISTSGGENINLNKLFRPQHYSYDPNIDWDKLVNYQEYYWLPTGPQSIVITGQSKNTTSTYTIRDSELGTAFIFNPDGLTEDPLITLYRGNTYHFDVQSAHKFYIKTAPSLGNGDIYNFGVTNNGISSGTVTIVINDNTPETLFYISGDQQLTQGQFSIKTIDQDSVVDVVNEIVGKKNYTSGTGVQLSNGMKIRFGGTVYPESYRDREYFVEGVGTAIKLIDYETLTASQSIINVYDEDFDINPFDSYPFDNFKSLPIDPEYITINRASRDLNPWTRYNRWVHSDVITASALANNITPVYPANNRARRPIIEFNADLKLYNYGSVGIKNVDLIDTDTKDAFSIVEGSAGYHIDGILLQQGHRVIFNADTDSSVRGKIYQVNFITLNNRLRVELVATDDHTPVDMASVSVNLGTVYAGASWWFNGDKWIFSQQHTKLNQPPLFDLFDNQGNSYADENYYLSSFSGNKIFGYDIGTGVNDTVLGFPLKYKNSSGVGSYLFKNYFMTDSFKISIDNVEYPITTDITYCRFAESTGDIYTTVWKLAKSYEIPILQFQVLKSTTSTIEVNCVDNAGVVSDILVDVFVNNNKLVSADFVTTSTVRKLFVNFVDPVVENSQVLFKVYTNSSANTNGYYEAPLGLTNNPLNGPISSLTLTELSDHLHTMADGVPNFVGTFPGKNNLRDIANVSKYGSRLVSNANPIAFAHMFIGKKEHSVIDAISKAGNHYNQFKMAFLKKISDMGIQTDPVAALDAALKDLNKDKDLLSPYFLSDMIPYGTDKVVRTWTVTDSRNTIYPISSDFDPSVLNLRAVLVYLNGSQLIRDVDYQFLTNDSSVEFLIPLVKGDEILINDYTNTEGSFVPVTPTKLGLYPKYVPSLFIDDTYLTPVAMIQGHDGSLTTAYNDFRDDIILEFEKRIYNNIKAVYKDDLFDINSVLPGAFRTTDFSVAEVNKILQRDFVRWAGFYGIDYTTNSSFDQNNSFTWNFLNAYSEDLGIKLSGSWRAVYNYYYGTDKPHSRPWEMLGFTEMPLWWEDEYGEAPYTSGNDILWEDIKLGRIKQGPRQGINQIYARPQIYNILPVDEFGNLVNPLTVIDNTTSFNRRQSWKFGDQGPAETAWRKSSYWPFAVQTVLALTNPASYCSLLYDPSRLEKNIAGQWTYGTARKFLNLNEILIHDDERTLTSGYSVLVSEIGQQRSLTYIQSLKQDLQNSDFNLFHKVGGFVSKDKLQIVIDSVDPVSTSPGALLPQEDYNLILNTSNPIKTVGISGLIVQKNNGKFVIKGYDRYNSYFPTYSVIRNSTSAALTVGGVSESFVKWTESSTGGNTGLSAADTTTAVSATTGHFYTQGQLVEYGGKYYRTTVSHQSTAAFNTAYFQALPALPVVGGATVQRASRFDSTVVNVPYGSEFSTIQEVYDVIVGYGKWLEDQGFIFDEYNVDLGSVIDWNFTAKEFLYWTTQNWAPNSVITLSPFADKIKFSRADSVVDNVFNSFYEYSIYQADGTPLPQTNINVTRVDGLCTIETVNSTSGIYFAVIHSVQKEHAMVFNNTTLFNDTIYNIETGYRQRRMKLTGFRTSNWNGDYFSPGFVYDSAAIYDWTKYTGYRASDVVRYNGFYYSAIKNIEGSSAFDFTKWAVLDKKPEAGLIPNFDYKITQFEDFYSLDIDNFDSAQQKMAQHLIGYTPRVYLNNIFTNPISQYKFYQGFIKEKGTKNSVSKLAKASIHNLQGELDYTEEWAFRIGQYGAYENYQELEASLKEGAFIENPQIINFVDVKPTNPNDLIYYSTNTDRLIVPTDYSPANTFKITTSTTYLDNDFKLSIAGYARIDDVTATAYNENSLLDIANNRNINEGDVIWLGFKQNGDWDVLRYTRSTAKVVGVFVSNPTVDITFVTDYPHNLKVGSIISITQFNDQVNGVHLIKEIPKIDQITVSSTLSAISNAELPSPGALFEFTSARYPTYDNLVNENLLKLSVGTKLWVDNDSDPTKESGKWKVYQKVKNYSGSTISSSADPANQYFGWSLNKRHGNSIFVAGAPNFYQTNLYGRAFVFNQVDNNVQRVFNYGLNTDAKSYEGNNTPNEFGHAVAYDDYKFPFTNYGLFFTGAPGASYVKATGTVGVLRYSTGTDVASTYLQEGIVSIGSVDPILVEHTIQYVLASPALGSYQRFGSSIFVEKDTSTKLLFVGAPGTRTTGTGEVYCYTISTSSVSSTTAGISVSSGTVSTLPSSLTSLNTGSQWGYTISGSDDATVIAVGAPGYPNKNTNSGLVKVFTSTNYNTPLQTINSPFGTGSRFGEKVVVSSDGSYMFVTSPDARNPDQSYGKVAIYKKLSTVGTYTLTQILINPLKYSGIKFGYDIDVNLTNDALAVSSNGTNNSIPTTFDKGSSLTDQTTFDALTTNFYGSVTASGAAYVYTRKFNKFILTEELEQSSRYPGTNFGHSVLIDDTVVFVGAPASGATTTSSAIYQYNKLDDTVNGLSPIREQGNTVDIDIVQKVSLIDGFNEELVDYLDIIDPLKGKIAGLADQELKYKSAFDPAVYSIGMAGTVNDTDSNWLDEHLGDLWWDLSSVKYVWYEQGDLTYRKNNWGTLFPGATIDVYEWVGSQYLPSEWSSKADTAAGLTEGVSGQPKYVDNSVVSVKQIYSYVTNSFSNYYYYWVKNKITIPNVKNRRISAYQVASLIADPTAYGLRYASILSEDSVALANVGPLLVDDRIHLNVALEDNSANIQKHTEWLLLQEGSENSKPNALLEKKLFDSLLGHDSLGNPVPDESLTVRTKYGIGIRPRQTLFKDRFEALRNLIEFTNNVLLENLITGNYSFANLSAQETIPELNSHQYDQIVEDNEGLLVIDTRNLKTAQLTCTVKNGKLWGVSIADPGFGYTVAPTVRIATITDSSPLISTQIDEFGRVTKVTIEDPGFGFSTAPSLEVRPYTVVVLADTNFNGKWTFFNWETVSKKWVRSHTQQYNTELYWKYVDWVSSSYNRFLDYEDTIDDLYQLDTLSLDPGQYVKVKNIGDGRYAILEKTKSGVHGTFSADYNIVYSQNGTIQILDSIWNTASSSLGFDKDNTFDQTLFDQTADLELQYILRALKNDIFINELKINWNLFFFKAVKYALSEQKLLDWTFKTSFINVVNYAGSLDQRPVYKLQNSSYYEDYLKEVKPYHTTIRNFTTNYTVVEPTHTYTTDFDLPAHYNPNTGKFTSVTVGNDLLNQYPWKSWADNYSFEIGSIVIGNSGAGYTLPPEVMVEPASGDSGTGATAKAFIRSGEVFAIEVTNPGSGYKKAPVVTIVGGGDTVLTSAIAYAQLTNNKVRNNLIGIKFDRISGRNQIGDLDAIDSFICNGSDNTFVLTWLAAPNKLKITVKLDGVLVLGADYTIEYYVGESNGYKKKYSKLVFLNNIPGAGQVLEIQYRKNVSLLHAAERIENYYSPNAGMPGNELSQVMSGIEYPKTRIDGLPFDYTTKWDIEYAPFGTSSWADDVGLYNKVNIVSTATAGTDTVIVNTTTGIMVGHYANIVSSTSTIFATQIADKNVNVSVVSINRAARRIKFSSTITQSITATTHKHVVNGLETNYITTGTVEFWGFETDVGVLDSAINGGAWSATTSNYYVGALGINPEDIIIDGDAFLSPNTSYAPEELVPGQVAESIGINVYTKNSEGAPIIFANNFDVYASNTTTVATLAIVPPGENYITVVFANQIFVYNTNTSFTTSTQFTINWETNQLIIPPQESTGKLGYTIVGMGGGLPNTEAGVIDSALVTTSEEDRTAQVQSLSSIDTVQSAYVTVDGIAIPRITTTADYGYTLTNVSLYNQRAAVDVYNLPEGKHTVQAWFFDNPYKYFNEINEQVFDANDGTTTFTLTNPPGTLKPEVGNAIVELYSDGYRRRMVPPKISYYEYTGGTATFDIDSSTTWPDLTFPSKNAVRVYVNGRQLSNFDFDLNTTLNTISVHADQLGVGDVVAIIGLKTRDDIGPIYEYDIIGSSLILTQGSFRDVYDVKVITYTDHDDMLMRTEKFIGTASRRYKISRQIYDINYVWVTVNGIPLTAKLDYEILDDQMTVQISDYFDQNENDVVVITSVSSNKLASTILGYRVFNDIFNRTHFKRLSKKYTTYLTKPLNFTDTEIYVADASVLTDPIPSKNIPGIVLIDGERIEFFVKDGNILRQLRRSTLGTAPSLFSGEYTKVIDQSIDQTIPFSENVYKQIHITTSTTSTRVVSTSSSAYTYIISTSSYVVNTQTDHQINSDGIKIQTSFTSTDQIAVYYGGRLLSKAGSFYHDTTVAYDSPDVDFKNIGSTSTVYGLPNTTLLGTAYIVTTTNSVWVYTASTEQGSVDGYVYKGLKYRAPEFSIKLVGDLQQIVLNIEEGVDPGIKLMMVKREFEKSKVWNDINPTDTNTTKSLMDSNSTQARFLQLAPAELPDQYYYGGDTALISSSGFALTDNNDDPLEGF